MSLSGSVPADRWFHRFPGMLSTKVRIDTQTRHLKQMRDGEDEGRRIAKEQGKHLPWTAAREISSDGKKDAEILAIGVIALGLSYREPLRRAR